MESLVQELSGRFGAHLNTEGWGLGPSRLVAGHLGGGREEDPALYTPCWNPRDPGSSKAPTQETEFRMEKRDGDAQTKAGNA